MFMKYNQILIRLITFPILYIGPSNNFSIQYLNTKLDNASFYITFNALEMIEGTSKILRAV